MLEQVLKQAENAALDKAAKLSNGHADYYDGKLGLSPDDVTQ
jgi:hypothetical protein